MLFFVLLRSVITNQLCEILIFNRFFKDLPAKKLVKEPKNIPQATKKSPLILAENFAGKKRLAFDLN